MVECSHLSTMLDVKPRADVCEECALEGNAPVALRVCTQCGHIGCCDSSPGQHARRHFHETGHPIIVPLSTSASWRWCYVDDTYV